MNWYESEFRIMSEDNTKPINQNIVMKALELGGFRDVDYTISSRILDPMIITGYTEDAKATGIQMSGGLELTINSQKKEAVKRWNPVGEICHDGWLESDERSDGIGFDEYLQDRFPTLKDNMKNLYLQNRDIDQETFEEAHEEGWKKKIDLIKRDMDEFLDRIRRIQYYGGCKVYSEPRESSR